MICKLCKNDEKLCKSHIIPEWAYKHIYDERHRLNEISTVKSERNRSNLQKGLYERLLCIKCESRLGQYDKYCKELLYDDNRIKIDSTSFPIEISNVNYTKLKLFQLSVLWRASVSTLEFFSDVDLGPHEEIIRHYLIGEKEPSETEYGCTMCPITTDDRKKKVVDDILFQPEKMRQSNHVCYRFIFAGMMWYYYVSNHDLPLAARLMFLSRNGTLLIAPTKAEDTELFTLMAAELKKQNKI